MVVRHSSEKPSIDWKRFIFILLRNSRSRPNQPALLLYLTITLPLLSRDFLNRRFLDMLGALLVPLGRVVLRNFDAPRQVRSGEPTLVLTVSTLLSSRVDFCG
jgi:hypothetical protein